MNKTKASIKDRLQNILSFWFIDENKPKWFIKDKDFDQQILTKFHDLYAEILPKSIVYKGDSAQTILAVIILLDQFPRNMFRNTAQAFATDHKALALTKKGIREFLDEQLSSECKLFFYMPLMHSENLADQELSVRLFTFDENAHQYAKAHFDLIKRFGRFPHRNKALGRESTKEELEFLASNPSGF